MLFTKWRFLFNIVSNSRNPSFVKVYLKEGPAAMRGFLRFKHDISESTSNQIPDRPKQSLYPLWLRWRMRFHPFCASHAHINESLSVSEPEKIRYRWRPLSGGFSVRQAHFLKGNRCEVRRYI